MFYLQHVFVSYHEEGGGEASGKSVGIYKHFFSCNLSIFCVVISQVSPSFSLYRHRNQPHQFHEFTGKRLKGGTAVLQICSVGNED